MFSLLPAFFPVIFSYYFTLLILKQPLLRIHVIFLTYGYFNPGCGSTGQSIPSIPNEPNWTQATHHKSLQRSWKKNNCFLFFESFTSCDMEL